MNYMKSKSARRASAALFAVVMLLTVAQGHIVRAADSAPIPSKVTKARLFTDLGIVQYLRLVGTHLDIASTVELVIGRRTFSLTIVNASETNLLGRFDGGVIVGKGVLRITNTLGDISEYGVEVVPCASASSDDLQCGRFPNLTLYNLVFYP